MAEIKRGVLTSELQLEGEIQERLVDHLSRYDTPKSPQQITETIKEEMLESGVLGRYPTLDWTKVPVSRRIARELVILIEGGDLSFTDDREVRLNLEKLIEKDKRA